jgi:DNA-binding CsgD family transcriptional regulator
LGTAVAGLSATDAERVLGFVAEAEASTDDQPFTPELLVELGRLVEADWVSYCELDRVRCSVRLQVQRAGDPEDDELDDDLFWGFVSATHPTCVARQRGVTTPLKLSDFLSRARLRRSELYDVWFRPLNVERELDVPIPSPRSHTKTCVFHRGDGSDFSERDRLVLQALQPHLSRLWHAARTRRLLAAAVAALDGEAEHEGRGVVLLADGDVAYASPRAQRLLREFFPESTVLLPSLVAEWLQAGGPLHVRHQSGRRLTITKGDGALLLEQENAPSDLTAREREVLSWVARGKTNREIAERLWIAPGTVRKHLENVYAKLGVKTRTAAVARLLGRLDGEAS